MDGSRLMTVAAMAAVDAAAIAGGIPGIALMRAAGAAVAERARGPACRRAAGSLVLCGPGNNGGDGFVAARLLAEAGFVVGLALLGAREALSGDAALAAAEWTRGGARSRRSRPVRGRSRVDALFGAGLSRDDRRGRPGSRSNGSRPPRGRCSRSTCRAGSTATPAPSAASRSARSRPSPSSRPSPATCCSPAGDLCGRLARRRHRHGCGGVRGRSSAGAPMFRNGPEPVERGVSAARPTRATSIPAATPSFCRGRRPAPARRGLPRAGRCGSGPGSSRSPRPSGRWRRTPPISPRSCCGLAIPPTTSTTCSPTNASTRSWPGPASASARRPATSSPWRRRAGRGLVLDADALTSFEGQAGAAGRPSRGGRGDGGR